MNGQHASLPASLRRISVSSDALARSSLLNFVQSGKSLRIFVDCLLRYPCLSADLYIPRDLFDSIERFQCDLQSYLASCTFVVSLSPSSTRHGGKTHKSGMKQC